MVEASKGAGLSESFVETSDLVVIHIVEQMGVGVHRLRDGRVPKQRLDDLRALALVEEFGSEGVP